MDLIYLILIVTLFFVIIPWAWRYHWRPWRAKKQLRQWLGHHPKADQFIVSQSLLNTLYRGLNAESVSKKERKRLHLEEDAFVYGEINFLSFMLILDRVQPRPGETFYDLGCGAGKALLVAALGYDLGSVVGVELLPGLCRMANMQINKTKTLIQLSDARLKQNYLRRVEAIQIINANYLEMDFSDADIIFINATCLPYHAWESLVEKFKLLKTGSRIIVTTKKINQTNFEIVYQGTELMSWGMNSVNIYRKIAGSRPSADDLDS